MHIKIINTISLIALLCITGCSTLSQSSNPKTINMQITHSGKCQIENKIVSIPQLPRAIKSAGGSSESRIVISVQKDVNYVTVKEILRTLSDSGYVKVHMQTPRQATSYINN